jgi:hypothetical protein
MSTAQARCPDITTLTTEQKNEFWNRSGVTGRAAAPAEHHLHRRYLEFGISVLSEDQDAYMVGLCCTNPHCPTPHTGVRLPAAQFLTS